jgi:hypothetical protein
MRRRIGRMLLLLGLLASASSTLFGQERWIYRYNGLADSSDNASSIVVGTDGNLYVAGTSYGSGTYDDLTVVSLTDSGDERWVYRYNGPGNYEDEAHAIAMGLDGNLYVAGASHGSGTLLDFTVVSLTALGEERWIYRRDGSRNYHDQAFSVVMGSDGNLYAAGISSGSVNLDEFTVVGLTDSGSERWVYQYDSPGIGPNGARTVVVGFDGYLYAAGLSQGDTTISDFTVVSLTDSGAERWVYRYSGIHNGSDQAYSIVVGSDSNLYAIGGSQGTGTSYDFIVVSLTDLGMERWVYRYNGPADGMDYAYSVATGVDGNLYVAGWSEGSGTFMDFTVVSLTDSGAERWVYRYDGSAHGSDMANSIVTASDGCIYVAGWSKESGTGGDFTVVSLDTAGVERWVYRYDGPANYHDAAYSIDIGSDGDLYAAGRSAGSATGDDLTVVRLGPDVGVEERSSRRSPPDLSLSENEPNPFSHSTVITYSPPTSAHITLAVYDITGRLVETLVSETQQPGMHRVRWNRGSNPSGVYFYSLRAGEFIETAKMVVVD